MQKLDYLVELNEEQQRAVLAPAGPILILAGAGSGKTRVLTYRVAHMIEHGVVPSSIMLVTFTNRAAHEMLRRIGQLCGPAANLIVGGTFHHIALRFLRLYGERLGYSKDFTLIDRDDARDVMNTVLKETISANAMQYMPKANVLLDMVSLALNTQAPIHSVIRERGIRFFSVADDIAHVCRKYLERKLSMNVMDFDDLLTNWKSLLKEHIDIADKIRSANQVILVDEYQDTNKLQSEIIDLMGQHHQNITVVGDDAQSIYGFRGADINNMLSFARRYPKAKHLTLATNYRSTPQILELANHSLGFAEEGFKKSLRAIRAKGNLPSINACSDGIHQAKVVAQRIAEFKRNGASLDDIAVLYRAHSHAMELQLELLHRQIPFVVRSGLRFFEQAHVKDVIAFIKLAYNPKDEVSFMRALKLRDGVGDKMAQNLWGVFKDRCGVVGVESLVASCKSKRAQASARDFYTLLFELVEAMKTLPPSQLIRLIMDKYYAEEMARLFTNVKERKDDIMKLADFSDSFAGLHEFLTELSLVATFVNDDSNYQGERVTLSSIHQAKGLEWNHVFVVWLNEGRFPSEMALREANGLEEERRLMYVAVTRAKDTLALSYAEFQGGAHGGKYYLMPSRFVGEISHLGVNEVKRYERYPAYGN